MKKPKADAGRRHPEANWRVLWADFSDNHDWIGRGPVKSGGVYTPHRRKPPSTSHNDFITREGADEFVLKLRRDVPADELVVQVVSLDKPARPLPDPLLPGEWPRQGRRLIGPEWPEGSKP